MSSAGSYLVCYPKLVLGEEQDKYRQQKRWLVEMAFGLAVVRQVWARFSMSLEELLAEIQGGRNRMA